MGDIYAHAQQTLVWLGPASEDDYLAFEAIKDLEKGVDMMQSKDLMPRGYSGEQVMYEELYQFFSEVVDSGNMLRWKHLAHILNREWFERVWVIQEIAKSKTATVVCGKQEMPWKTFAESVKVFGLTGLHLSLDIGRRGSIQTNLTKIHVMMLAAAPYDEMRLGRRRVCSSTLHG